MKNLLGIRASVGATLIAPSNGDRAELQNSLRVLVGDFCERAAPSQQGAHNSPTARPCKLLKQHSHTTHIEPHKYTERE